MTALALAALTFTLLHLLVSGTRLRDVLVARLGEGLFRGLFSLASAAALGWLIWAYGQVRMPEVTALADWRWLAAVLMGVALAFIVLGLVTPGPTIVGGEKLLQHDDPARGIHRVTRHPFLWGVALWSAVHLAYNAGAANLAFFGTFLVVSAAGTFSIDAKRARIFGELWQRYAARTSNLPFAAILQGRNRLVAGEFGLLALGAAVGVFVVVSLVHARLFGLPPF